MIRRLAILVFWTSRLAAQEASSDKGWITVETFPPGADVYVDSQFCGKTPLEHHALDARTHVLSVFAPSVTSWNSISKTDTIAILANHETRLKWELGSMVPVNTIPSGSFVLYADRPLGVTPLVLKSAGSLKGEIIFQKEGYRPVSMDIDDLRSAHVVRLKQIDALNQNLGADILGPMSNGAPSDQWLHYVAGATMIVSGFFAAYFKEQANASFKDYQESQDPARLNATRNFDRLSGFSFTLTQVSFGVLAYKLLLE